MQVWARVWGKYRRVTLLRLVPAEAATAHGPEREPRIVVRVTAEAMPVPFRGLEVVRIDPRWVAQSDRKRLNLWLAEQTRALATGRPPRL